jgi:acetylornithine deacetylase/succinyl-diaminopimelate desuccinylase-like protein
MLRSVKLVPFLSVLFLLCNLSNSPTFDKDKAFRYLSEQCDFGPRNPGSNNHLKTKNYLLDKLNQSANLVNVQDFVYHDSTSNLDLNLTNIIASFYPQNRKRILLAAHWDTRPFADREPDSILKNKPILGANDGASGVAVLLEIASILSQKAPKYGVDIVFFDGEDWGKEASNDYCLGSRYFASHLGEYRPEFSILLDMIGDKDLQIYKEGYSARYAFKTMNLVWSKARKLKLGCFVDSVKYTLIDDHIALIEAGIPCIDLIDFDYPYWHTLQDTPDKCSAESLDKIGKLLIEVLYH